MAAPIMCNGPDGGPAVVMVTMLADGDTVGLCAPCLTDWCHALIKATAPDLLATELVRAKAPARRKAAAGGPALAPVPPDGGDAGKDGQDGGGYGL